MIYSCRGGLSWRCCVRASDASFHSSGRCTALTRRHTATRQGRFRRWWSLCGKTRPPRWASSGRYISNSKPTAARNTGMLHGWQLIKTFQLVPLVMQFDISSHLLYIQRSLCQSFMHYAIIPVLYELCSMYMTLKIFQLKRFLSKRLS